MKKRTKVVTILVVGVAVAGTAGWFYMRKSASKGPAGDPVRIEAPVKGDLVEIVNAPGEVQPRTQVSISAKVSARIIEMPYEEGARVTKGDPNANPPVPPSLLLRLDAADLEANLRSAEARRSAQAAQIDMQKSQLDVQRATLDGARASLLQAQRDLDRTKALCGSKICSQADLDAAQSKYDQLKSQVDSAVYSIQTAQANIEVSKHNVEAADADIAQARDAVSYTTITAPIDGVVTRINAKVGEMVMTGTMNNAGTVIMEVADLSQMLLVVQVDEGDVGHIKVGQKANVRIHTYPDVKFTGAVEQIALTHDLTSAGAKYFKTKILLDKTDRQIYSGLTADVDILAEEHKGVLKVPSQAILGRPVDGLPLAIRENNPNVDIKKTYATVVYRFRDSKAVVTPVTVGPGDATHTIVTAGLAADDKVIVGPYKILENLSNDQKVQDEREIEKKKKDAEKASQKGIESTGARVESTAARVESTGKAASK